MSSAGRRLGRSLAITLRVYDYSETSQIVHLYARDYGKVHAIAKGSKRRRSPFRGPFDVLCLYEIIRLEKHPETLDLLTAAETLEDYRPLRESFDRLAAASYAADLVDEFTPEVLPQPELFDALRETLERLAGGADPGDAVLRFEAAFLRELGHFPRLDTCGACRRPVAGSNLWFSVRDGGVLCERHPPRDPARIRVRRVVVDALAAMRRGRPFRLDAYLGLPGDLRRVLDAHLRFVFDREPKSWRLLCETVFGIRPATAWEEVGAVRSRNL